MISVPGAAVLPHRSGYIIVVQSPNGRWLLLSGHSGRAVGEAFVTRHGYRLIDAREALDQIEQQDGWGPHIAPSKSRLNG